MSDLAAAIKQAEEALAGFDNLMCDGPSYEELAMYARSSFDSALRALLDAATGAEADIERLTRQHEGCDAQARSLVSQGLAAIRRAEQAEAALAEERRRREEAFAAANLTGLPVHFVSFLPRGHIFMHPDTPKSGVRDPFGPFPPTEAPR